MKFNARAFTHITFDFEIEAESEQEVEEMVTQHLKYVAGGKLDDQKITINTDDSTELTNIFVMEVEIEDVYELD